MIEHRLSDRLTTYWHGLRKDLPLPDFGHFNASSIADIWQHCVLFTVSPAIGEVDSIRSAISSWVATQL